MEENLRVIADLHIHSRYSMATSERMCIEEAARFSAIKGLTLIGTGDFTHPKWFKELHEDLVPEQNVGLFNSSGKAKLPVYFILTAEVSTVFTFENKVRKVHHVILAPDVETVAQLNDTLSKYGDLGSDGRPTLDMNAAHLVEEVISVSDRNMIFPAHVWTPWFSVFGAFSGFNSIEECYQDMSKHIYALETGLSSDPPMNWRLSMLDRYTLVSNSDSHSFWPWRIGREANVFELDEISYTDVLNAIRQKDNKHFKYTIETDPAYGKYHWTGHRSCRIALPPNEALKLGNVCPVCRKKLTLGVEQRVEELADRSPHFQPSNAIGYKHLLPLSEIIAAVLGLDSPSAQKVWDQYNLLIGKFGNEYSVLLDAKKSELSNVADERIADAVVRAREDRITVVPGYDGVYGKLVISGNDSVQEDSFKKAQQRSLTDFVG